MLSYTLLCPACLPAPQIIHTVQAAASGSGLAVPPPDALPAGPLAQVRAHAGCRQTAAAALAGSFQVAGRQERHCKWSTGSFKPAGPRRAAIAPASTRPPRQLTAHFLPTQLPHSNRQYGEYVALMEACWARDPAQRPTMEAVATRLRNILAAGGLRWMMLHSPAGCCAVGVIKLGRFAGAHNMSMQFCS